VELWHRRPDLQIADPATHDSLSHGFSRLGVNDGIGCTVGGEWVSVCMGYCRASSIAVLTDAAPSTPYKLVDLHRPYASFWDESQNMPAAERLAAFKARFETLLLRVFLSRARGPDDKRAIRFCDRSID